MEHASNLQILENLVLLWVQNLEQGLFHTLVKPQRKRLNSILISR